MEFDYLSPHDWMEWRRRRALQLKQGGWKQRSLAAALNVSEGGLVQTSAPRGITPVLAEWQSRDHLSVMGAVTPQGKVYTLVRHHALNGMHSLAFLEHLLRSAAERLLVIWDGSPIHRRTEVQADVA